MSNNSTLTPGIFDCGIYASSTAVSTAYNYTKMALLGPLYTFILYLGAKKWKQQRSFTTTSHSEILTYHQVAFTFLGIFASFLYLCTADGSQILPTWLTFLFNLMWYGESYIQVLTCVEQYLAVVHPIVYMRLRNSRGVRIRNISIGCVWLLTSITSAFVSVFIDPRFPFLYTIPYAVCLVVVTFCCLSVLCVLIRPGPGEGGQERGRIDHSKQRAFHTIMAIFVVLVLWFGGISVVWAFYFELPIKLEVKCLLMVLVFWFNLPSGLVLPLLYLHRAGKLSFCCRNDG